MFTVLGTVSGVSSPLSCSCRVLLESTQLEGTVAGRGRASPLAPLCSQQCTPLTQNLFASWFFFPPLTLPLRSHIAFDCNVRLLRVFDK